MSSIWDWSVIAATNANADAGINWAEGQPPSTVNNSARAMMQRVKELLNDLGGITAVTGTANSLTLAASSAFTAYEDGLRVSFRAASANSAASTLNVNGIGSKPIVKFTSAGETALAGGELQVAGIYEVVYSEALNGAAGAWLLLNPTPAATELPGFIKSFGGVNPPTGYLACDGTAVSRTTYAGLFTAISTVWGVGNGTTTFNVPDLRDDFIRGASSTLTVGTKQTELIKNHVHPGTTASSGTHDHSYGRGDPGGGSPISAAFGNGDSFTDGTTSSDGAHTHTFTTNNNTDGGAETRPRNGVVLFVIKT